MGQLLLHLLHANFAQFLEGPVVTGSKSMSCKKGAFLSKDACVCYIAVFTCSNFCKHVYVSKLGMCIDAFT